MGIDYATDLLGAVDHARGDRSALEALLADDRLSETAEGRAATFRIRRFLKELKSRADGHPGGARVVSSALADSIVRDLENDDAFLLDGAALPALLAHARGIGAERACDILTTLSRFRAYSARSLLLKVGDPTAFEALGRAVKEWLWAFALKSPDAEEPLELLQSWPILFPRRLLPLIGARESAGHGDQVDVAGYVYLLREDATDPCILKIGMTSKLVQERVAELNSSTSQHRRLTLLMEWPVADPRAAERRVHGALAQYRVRSGREFFQLDARCAMRIIDDVLAEA